MSETLRTRVQGSVPTRFKEEDRQIDIRIRNREEDRQSLADVRNLVARVTADETLAVDLKADAQNLGTLVQEKISRLPHVTATRTVIAIAMLRQVSIPPFR